jgi:arylsulfotransferase ASST
MTPNSARTARLGLLVALSVGLIAGVLLQKVGVPGFIKWKLQVLIVGDEKKEEDTPRGVWRPIDERFRDDMTDRERETRAQLAALGYMDGYVEDPGFENVTVYDPAAAFNGYNLYTSGDSPHAVLVDMKGETLHEWRYELLDVWPDFTPPDRWAIKSRDFWRRVYLYPNGDLLAIYDGVGMIKLDKDSNLIWASRGGYHHDIDVMPDGSMFTLARTLEIVPRINPDDPILHDFICELDAEGNELRRISLLKCFERSRYASVLDKMAPRGDTFHTNTIEILDGRHADRSPIFREGNALISIFQLNTIAIVDLETKQIVWALYGLWVKQHEPILLDNGNLLVFDNQGHEGRSKVIEIDPFTQELRWSYADGPGTRFYSDVCGSNARLPNGNTLITESTGGRAFEVTPDKTIVWEYFNPYRAGEDDELIACLYEVIRIPPDFPLDWAENVPTFNDPSQGLQ